MTISKSSLTVDPMNPGRLLAITLALLGAVAPVARADDRPNILFIMSDDHTSEAIGAYDSWLKDWVHTPTIDQLAAEGMRMTNVCCNNSICSPSRASIISGQYSHITGALNLGCELKPDSPSYIVELQKAGYQTAVVGKWHMKQWPRGCDDYAVTTGQGNYFNPTLHRPDGSKQNYQGYYADVYTDRALDWLKERKKDEPFYLSLHFKGPHESFDFPDRWAHLHEGVDIPEPASLHEDVAKTSPKLKAQHYSFMNRDDAPKPYYQFAEGKMPRKSEDEKERASIAYQHIIHKYIRCVAASDENIKRVLDYLEAEGVKDNTVIIYTSDQGYWLGQHGMFDKRLMLETSLKMPFIIRYPAEIPAGSVSDALASNVDFGPTMLDFARTPVPQEMQGVSLRPVLRGETPDDWREGVFYAYYARAPQHWGVRTQRYKLIHFPGTEEVEFYDLERDPEEMTDQAGNPEYAERISQLDERLDALMEDVSITPEFLDQHMKGMKKSPARSAVRKGGKGKKAK